MTASEKDGKREQIVPEVYLEFQRKKTADEERILRETERCFLIHASYQKTVSEWNTYVAEIMAYADLFSRIAESLCLFAGFAFYHSQEPEKYGPQLINARNSLALAFAQSGGSVQNGVFTLPEVRESREFEKAEEFHLSEIKMPELTFAELEILMRLGEKERKNMPLPLAKTRQEELRGLIRRLRKEQKENLRLLREKQELFGKTADYLKRKLADREKHFIMKEAVQEVYPIVSELIQREEGNWQADLIQGKRLLKLWENSGKNRLCLLFHEEEQLPEEIRMEFKKAGGYQILCPGLYWRDVQDGKAVYERITTGWYR